MTKSHVTKLDIKWNMKCNMKESSFNRCYVTNLDKREKMSQIFNKKIGWMRWTALLKAVQNFWDERNCNIHSMILTVKISLKKVVIMLGSGDECTTWMMPWMNYEQLFPTHIPPQWENCPRSPRSSWPKITSWCKEMHWKNSEDLSPICHKWPVSADIHTLLQFKVEKYGHVWFLRPTLQMLTDKRQTN